MRYSLWLLLIPAVLGFTACTEASSPRKATPTTTSAAALMPSPPDPSDKPPEPLQAEPEPRERTFGIVPSPEELIERMLARRRHPLDTPEEQEALREVRKSLESFTYKPSKALWVVEPDLEEPMRGSFIADSEWATDQVQKVYGPDMKVSCVSRPCIRYGDFDGDGRRDLVVQVSDASNDKAGIAFLLADDTHALLGAGRESPVGDDLLWMDTWAVEPASRGGAATVVLSTAAKAARVQLTAHRMDGAREVKPVWSCMASSQVPPMRASRSESEAGLVTRSGVYENLDEFEAWRAFDDSPTESQWISEAERKSPVWIGYEWAEGPRKITSYALTFAHASFGSRGPRDFELQGTNSEEWVTLDRRTEEEEWKEGEERHYNITTPAAYRKYRLFITEGRDDPAPISLGHITLSGAQCDVAAR